MFQIRVEGEIMLRTRNCFGFAAVMLLVAALSACASDPSTQSARNKRPTESDPSKGIICTTELPTGSMLKVRKCTTPEEREQQRRDTEHQMVIESAPR
jgi:hypothetical protein